MVLVENAQGVLGSNELLGLDFGVGIPHLEPVVLGALDFLHFFQIHVPRLQESSGVFSERVVNDSVQRRLGSVRLPEGEGRVRQADVSSCVPQGTHTERNTGVVVLSEFVVVLRSHLAFYNCLLIQFHEITRVVAVVVGLVLVGKPGCAHLSCAFLVGLVWFSVGKSWARERPGGWLWLANIILDNEIVGSTSKWDELSLAYHIYKSE